MSSCFTHASTTGEHPVPDSVAGLDVATETVFWLVLPVLHPAAAIPIATAAEDNQHFVLDLMTLLNLAARIPRRAEYAASPYRQRCPWSVMEQLAACGPSITTIRCE
jgi:hypothetical protein